MRGRVMSRSGLLTELVTESLALNAGQDWDDVSLFTPYLNDQALLYEYADCLAAQTFLRMAQLPYAVKQRPNAEHISPTGKLPLLRVRRTLVSEFNGIVDFVSKKGVQLSAHLTDVQMAEMRAHMSVIELLLRNIEMYIVWKHDETYSTVTRFRYGSVYHWPLSRILPFLKRREVLTQLHDCEWIDKTMEDIVEQCEKAFRALSAQLGTHPFICGDQPTEADALLFGHLFTILTMRLPVMDIANTLRKYSNLIEFTKRIENDYFKQ